MPHLTRCPVCDHGMNLPDGADGKKLYCNGCETKLQILGQPESGEEYRFEVLSENRESSSVETSDDDMVQGTLSDEESIDGNDVGRRSRVGPRGSANRTSRPTTDVGKNARLAYIALVLPVVAALSQLISAHAIVKIIPTFAIFGTIALVIFDHRHLIDRIGDSAARRRVPNNPPVAMLIFIWAIGFPMAFASRKKYFGGPNLTWFAAGSSFILVAGLLLGAFLNAPGPSNEEAIGLGFSQNQVPLPNCDAAEPIALVRKLASQMAQTPVTVSRNHRELRYDDVQQVRSCTCTLVIRGKEVEAQYTISWQDRDSALFYVRVQPFDSGRTALGQKALPMANDEAVVSLLDDHIQKQEWAAGFQRSAKHEEGVFDESSKTRVCRCVIVRESSVEPLGYFITWADEQKGEFKISVVEPNTTTFPEADAPLVIETLNKILKRDDDEGKFRSTSAHRQRRLYEEKKERHCRCEADYGDNKEDIIYVIKWMVPEAGYFWIELL